MRRKTTMTRAAEPLKVHPAYVAEREARLAQLAIETPDCQFEECSDCCFLERISRDPLTNWRSQCPECDGRLRIGTIREGQIYA